jgi:hypothetical protein
VPLVQSWLLLQATKQSPQFSGSRWSCAGERHAPPHVCRPMSLQPTSWQTPSTHERLHAAPHAPQLFGSVAVSTHAPLQRVRPGRHVQAPVLQYSVSAHACPQAPQFVGLVCRLTQVLPQVSPSHEHVP